MATGPGFGVWIKFPATCKPKNRPQPLKIHRNKHTSRLLTAEKKLLSLVDDLKAVSYSEELRTGLSKYAEEVKAMPFVWVKKITPTSSLEAKLSAISILEEEIKPIYEGMREARRRIGKAPKSSDGETD